MYKDNYALLEVLSEDSQGTTMVSEGLMPVELINRIKHWNHGKDCFITSKEGNSEKITGIQIEYLAHPPMIEDAPMVATCGFESASRYMTSLLSRVTDRYDKEWYIYHEKTSSGGIDQDAAIAVINALVKPYGVGVSEVFVKRNKFLGSLATEIVASLGGDPAILTSTGKTSEEFWNENNMPPEVREMMSKVQIVDKLRGPVIIYEEYGNGSGHASYHGPRAVVDNFVYAFRLDHLDKITYQAPFPTLDYELLEENKRYVLDLELCMVPKALTGGEEILFKDLKYGSKYTGSRTTTHTSYRGNSSPDYSYDYSYDYDMVDSAHGPGSKVSGESKGWSDLWGKSPLDDYGRDFDSDPYDPREFLPGAGEDEVLIDEALQRLAKETGSSIVPFKEGSIAVVGPSEKPVSPLDAVLTALDTEVKTILANTFERDEVTS